MWTDRTSEECINKIKIPLKISAHLRGALKLLNNKSEIFRFFNPANKSEKPLELSRKDSLNRNSHMAMNHMWHVWFYFLAIRRLLQLVFQSLRSFSTGPALMVCAYWVRLAAVAPKAVESWRRRRRKTRLLQRGGGGRRTKDPAGPWRAASWDPGFNDFNGTVFIKGGSKETTRRDTGRWGWEGPWI